MRLMFSALRANRKIAQSSCGISPSPECRRGPEMNVAFDHQHSESAIWLGTLGYKIAK